MTVSSLSVTDSRRRHICTIVPNAFPASKLSATRDPGDGGMIEYVQVRWIPQPRIFLAFLEACADKNVDRTLSHRPPEPFQTYY